MLPVGHSEGNVILNLKKKISRRRKNLQNVTENKNTMLSFESASQYLFTCLDTLYMYSETGV